MKIIHSIGYKISNRPCVFLEQIYAKKLAQDCKSIKISTNTAKILIKPFIDIEIYLNFIPFIKQLIKPEIIFSASNNSENSQTKKKIIIEEI